MLLEHIFTVEHQPGVEHQNADTLSRHRMASSADTSGARFDEDAKPARIDPTPVKEGPLQQLEPQAPAEGYLLVAADRLETHNSLSDQPPNECEAGHIVLLTPHPAAPFSESLIASPEEHMAGWNGWAYETCSPSPESSDDVAAIAHAKLRQRALEWR